MTKISIITPTYNRFESLLKNIQSVKDQERSDIEHIIIDNLSTDGTKELVEKYRDEINHRVVYMRERDNEIYNAMNKGIREAKGEWLYFINDDDMYLDSEVLNNILIYIAKHASEEIEIVCGSVLDDKEKSNQKAG